MVLHGCRTSASLRQTQRIELEMQAISGRMPTRSPCTRPCGLRRNRNRTGQTPLESGQATIESSGMKLVTLKVNASDRIAAVKSLVPPALWQAVYRKLVVKDIPASYAYAPHYSPWLEPEFVKRAETAKGNTGLKPQSLYTLDHFLKDALSLDGDVIECGVWRGGSARLLRETIIERASGKRLFLFDSFEGMAAVNRQNDRHDVGDFADTSLAHVQRVVAGAVGEDPESVAVFRKGWIPETFEGLEDGKFCFAHIDLDLYDSIIDSLGFIYPLLSSRGIIVFDDYGFASCPGARKAVDEFFADKPEKPFVLDTAQAIVIKR
jgi:O-methyltransferase